MALLTLTDARNLMLKGRPWTFRMECTLNGRSAAWIATGRAQNEPVEVHFGAIGAKPTILVKDWSYVEKTAPEKVAKGYVYVDTPFVRVQPSTIGKATQPTTPVSPVIPLTPGPSKVAPLTPGPSNVIPLTFGQTPVIPMVAPPVVAPNLPSPWNLIVKVKQVGNQWIGVDSNGSKVLAMPKEAARRMVQNYAHISVMGL